MGNVFLLCRRIYFQNTNYSTPFYIFCFWLRRSGQKISSMITWATASTPKVTTDKAIFYRKKQSGCLEHRLVIRARRRESFRITWSCPHRLQALDTYLYRLFLLKNKKKSLSIIHFVQLYPEYPSTPIFSQQSFKNIYDFTWFETETCFGMHFWTSHACHDSTWMCVWDDKLCVNSLVRFCLDNLGLIKSAEIQTETAPDFHSNLVCEAGQRQKSWFQISLILKKRVLKLCSRDYFSLYTGPPKQNTSSLVRAFLDWLIFGWAANVRDENEF